nr:DNA topoisomerase 3 [Brucella intermedia]
MTTYNFDDLYVAEKPNLAEALALARGVMLGIKPVKAGGHWQVGNDGVTWLFGHMYGLEAPEAYDPDLKKWSMATLPIVPEKWKRTPHTVAQATLDKYPEMRKRQASKLAHLDHVVGLLKGAKRIINAGDAEREGQLLVDELLEENGIDPFGSDVGRVWVSSFAEKDIIKAINGIFPNSQKRNLFLAADARSKADWLHGMNMTRFSTIEGRKSGFEGVVNIGRVQTPTLKLVVDRDREIENFKPVDHYLPRGTFKHENGTFSAGYVIPEDMPGLDPEGRLIDKSAADAIANKIAGKQGRVIEVARSAKSKAPPLPYSLSALQSECATKLSLTAQETLDVAQALYEKYKATTYPRSDSRYLPKAILEGEAPQIMRNLAGIMEHKDAASSADMSLKSKAWDDSKVTDHHGIIPTMEATADVVARMTPMERSVFSLIAKAFIAQFHPDHQWNALSATVVVEGETFKATGKQITGQGWKVVYGASAAADDEDEDEGDSQSLPTMAKSDSVSVTGSDVSAKRTTPPSAFNDGTLIAAMTNVHKFVSNPAEKKMLKETSGIGTEATRANIIEGLLKNGFLTRAGKTKLVSADKGRALIDQASMLGSEIVSPGMTAAWEERLSAISRGEDDADAFLTELVQNLKRIIEANKTAGGYTGMAVKIEPLPGHGETCSKCGKGKMVTRQSSKSGKLFLGCNNWKKDDPNSCSHAIWPQSNDNTGEQCPQCKKGFLVNRKTKDGRDFKSCNQYFGKGDPKNCGYAVWPKEPSNFKAEEVGQQKVDGPKCTKCGIGVMVQRVSKKSGKKFLACNNWRVNDPTSCDAVDWLNEPSYRPPRPRFG